MTQTPTASPTTLPDLARIEETVVEIARAAGEMALKAFAGARTLEFKGKKQDDPVTATDREIETFLRTELRSHFPDHGLIGEEHADEVSPTASSVWVIDPIDGTANFAAGLPIWGVSMGLLHQGRPVVGCIWAPVGPALRRGAYHARLGGGTWFEDQRLAVSQGDDERGRVIALPGYHDRLFSVRRNVRSGLAKRADPRVLGSTTVEQALVAAGSLRGAMFTGPRLWDVAAGVLLVQEAGGSVHTWHDQRWAAFERFDPAPGDEKDPTPALRNWTQPVIVGPPSVVERMTESFSWRPRLSRFLRKHLGL